MVPIIINKRLKIALLIKINSLVKIVTVLLKNIEVLKISVSIMLALKIFRKKVLESESRRAENKNVYIFGKSFPISALDKI